MRVTVPTLVAGTPEPIGRCSIFALLIYGGGLLLSAFLTFVLEPMIGKMLLPLLGGSPAVWNTCILFFQSALLAGYAYAHVGSLYLGPRRHAVLHCGLLIVSLALLPVGLRYANPPSGDQHPVAWLLGTLALSIGLLFVLLTSHGPLLQRWFAGANHQAARDPYFLYAASNAGSLAGLVAYPFILEPTLSVGMQSSLWTAAYFVLLALVCACGVLVWRAAPGPVIAPSPAGPSPRWSERARWILLAFVPSSLLLGVTNYLTTDIAAIPLLWVIPLGLYLTTFILAFSPRSPIPHAFVVRWQPLTIIPAAIFLFWSAYLTIAVLLPFHVLMFFAAALLCHGELAARRPGTDRLTEFYLWVAGGGALGGLFNVLVAPAVFRSITEYPLILALVPLAAARSGNHSSWRHLRQALVAGAALLVPWFFLAPYNNPGIPAPPGLIAAGLAGSCIAAVACYQHKARPAMLSVALLTIAGVSVFADHASPGWILRERDFFGVHRIRNDAAARVHILYNGTTRHGAQSTEPTRRRQPLSYYARSGPAGDIFRNLDGTLPRRVGVIGLGAGALAAYARPRDHWTFFELDPAVVRIAQDPRFFTYLTDSEAGILIDMGDGRLSLAHVPDASLDLLVLDAFSSDAIPIHLLTAQALSLYFRKLGPGGVLAVHLSNRYLDLEPVVGNLVADRGLSGRVRGDTRMGLRPLVFVDPSIWAVVARSELDLGGLASQSQWRALRQGTGRVWTDDYSNVMGALRIGSAR